MSLRSFNTFILMLLIGLMNVFYIYKDHYSEERFLQEKLNHTNAQLEKERLENYLVNYHYREFQQNVASLIPEAVKSQPYNYSLRNLASIVDSPIPIELESATQLFKKGDRLYKDKKYELAIVEFKKIQNFYTDSVHLPEAVFLLAECQYQLKNFEEAVSSIEFLVSQFPEHILTGYALIRLGRINEKYERTDDAILNYQLVSKRFKQKDLRQQAEKMLEGIEL
ncbi:MAG: outer membrane protein assembly factor BamD [Bdellovibrionota bacterium]|nr:outer membrane protein assembly factor BamD [Bdellovibrionota bacterium]